MSELPLFPLQTVLLPDGLLALRVFEARYVDMVARCLRGENRFGVVAIREGAEVGAATTYDHGTSAEIVDWLEEQRGLLGILAVGREPFRLLETRREPDGLYVGSVEWLERMPAQKLLPKHEPLAALLKRLIEPLTLYRGAATSFDDAAWVGARLAELLPLAIEFKQSLLEMRDAEARLDRLAAALEPPEGGPDPGS
ncbi:MAG TPA: LON peptidase substrate-binding domain-containing protein [Gammaproteobacteria bacterium]|nr:LON peptidase substrate-binding domain-containing protein [Gammaproteobacteria bacterium]